MNGEIVVQARDQFLKRNGFDLEGYASPLLPLHIGCWVCKVPNPGLLHFHDLHHVATGFDTTLIGEAQISAFELRAGVQNRLVFALCVSGVICGLLLAPRKIIRVWRAAKGCRTLYDGSVPYTELLAMTVAELRHAMRLPCDGLNITQKEV